MIIFGSKTRETEVGSGQFFCPHCGNYRLYTRKRVGEYFTLYFLPIFRYKTLGEVVQCQVCRQNFDPAVLTYRPPPR